MKLFTMLLIKARSISRTIWAYITDEVVEEPTVNAETVGTNLIEGPGYIFSAGKSITLNNVIPLSTANSWEIQTKVIYNGGATYPCILALKGNHGDAKAPVFGHAHNNQFHILLSASGGSWDLYNNDIGLLLEYGKTYYFKFGFTGTQYYVWYSNIGWNDEGNTINYLNSSQKVYCNDITMIGNNYLNNNYWWGGLIDLENFKIIIDNQIWFDGLTAVKDVDYTVNNNPQYLPSKSYCNFSRYNYFKIPIDNSNMNSFEYIIKAKTPVSYGRENSILQYSGSASSIVYRINTSGNVHIYMSSNGSSWNVKDNWYPGFTIPTNTDVWFMVKWDGTTYTVGYSLDGINYTTSSWDNSSKLVWTDGYQYLGGCSNEESSWQGIIYMDECYLKINNELAWTGYKYPLNVGDDIKINEGLGYANYMWNAYPKITSTFNEFTLDSVIKNISTDEEGNRVIKIDKPNIPSNNVELKSGLIYRCYENINNDSVYIISLDINDKDYRITNNGCSLLPDTRIYTGGNNKYLLLNTIPDLSTADSWEFKFKTTYNGGSTYPAICGTSDDKFYHNIHVHFMNGRLCVWLSSDGNTWFCNGETNGRTTCPAINNNIYYVKLIFTGDQYKVWWSSVGWDDLGTTDILVNTNKKVNCSSRLALLNIYGNDQIWSRYYYNGSIDINESSITINNIENRLGTVGITSEFYEKISDTEFSPISVDNPRLDMDDNIIINNLVYIRNSSKDVFLPVNADNFYYDSTDGNSEVILDISTDDYKLKSDAPLTQKRKYIDTSKYFSFDLDYLNDYNTKVIIEGKEYKPYELPCYVTKDMNIQVVVYKDSLPIGSYIKSFWLNQNQYYKKQIVKIRSSQVVDKITAIINSSCKWEVNATDELIVEVYEGDHIDYTVEKNGYASEVSFYDVPRISSDGNPFQVPEYIINTNLIKVYKYEFEVNVTNANIELDSTDMYRTEDNWIEVFKNATILYKITKDQYKTAQGTILNVTQDFIETITLEPIDSESINAEIYPINVTNVNCDIYKDTNDHYIASGSNSNPTLSHYTYLLNDPVILPLDTAKSWEIQTTYRYFGGGDYQTILGSSRDDWHYGGINFYSRENRFRLDFVNNKSDYYFSYRDLGITPELGYSYKFKIGQIIEDNEWTANDGGGTKSTIYVDYIKSDRNTTGNPLLTSGGNVPSIYKKAYYIQSSGTQYINTGISAPNGFIIKTKISMSNSGNEWRSLCGSHESYSPYKRNFVMINYNQRLSNAGVVSCGQGNGDKYARDNSIYLNTIYDIEASNIYNNTYIKINGENKNLTTEPTPTNSYSSRNLYIFADNNGSSLSNPSQYFAGKMYATKIIVNDNIVRNYIPVLNTLTNKFGFYDTISEQFFGNSGSGELTGELVDEEYSCESSDNNEEAWNAFNDNNNSWINSSQVPSLNNPIWISYYTPTAIKPKSFTVINDDSYNNMKSGIIEGSTDNESWETIYTINRGQQKNLSEKYLVDTDKKYNYFRLKITERYDNYKEVQKEYFIENNSLLDITLNSDFFNHALYGDNDNGIANFKYTSSGWMLNDNIINYKNYFTYPGLNIVGELNNQNGVYSGFSGSNYINMTNNLDSSSVTEMQIKFTTGSNVNDIQNLIFGTNQDDKVFFNIYNGYIQLCNKIWGKTTRDSHQNTNLQVLPETTYWFKMTQNVNSIDTYISSDGINWTQGSTVTKNNNKYGTWIGTANQEQNYYFKGLIDINETYVKIGNDYYFNGASIINPQIGDNFQVYYSTKINTLPVTSTNIKRFIIDGFPFTYTGNYTRVLNDVRDEKQYNIVDGDLVLNSNYIENKNPYVSVPLSFLGSSLEPNSHYSLGSIDLTDTKCYINNELYWEAIKNFNVDDEVILNRGYGLFSNQWMITGQTKEYTGPLSKRAKITSINNNQAIVTPLYYTQNELEIIPKDGVSTIDTNIETLNELPTKNILINAINSDSSEIDDAIISINTYSSDIRNTCLTDNYREFYIEQIPGQVIEFYINSQKYIIDDNNSILNERVQLRNTPKNNLSYYYYNIYENNILIQDVQEQFLDDRNIIMLVHKFNINVTNVSECTINYKIGNKIYSTIDGFVYCYSNQIIEYEVSKQGYTSKVGSFTVPLECVRNNKYTIDIEL